MNPRFSIIPYIAIALTAVVAWSGIASAQGRDRSMQLVSEYPLLNDDGQRLPNHSVKLAGPIDKLPGVVVGAASWYVLTVGARGFVD